MMLVPHAAASAVTSAVFFYFTRSWLATGMCFLSGIFIDLDHVLDFAIEKKKICRNFEELEDFCLNETQGRMFLFMHSFELMAVLWISFLFFRHVVLLGFLVGASVHLILDQIFNDIYPWAYSWFYRRKFRFPKEIFFKKRFIEKLKSGR